MTLTTVWSCFTNAALASHVGDPEVRHGSRPSALLVLGILVLHFHLLDPFPHTHHCYSNYPHVTRAVVHQHDQAIACMYAGDAQIVDPRKVWEEERCEEQLHR